MKYKELKQQWENLTKEDPKLRIVNAAKQLGVSEVELLALNVGTTVTRLKNEPKSILKDLRPLRKVMALTRNENCVHERKGVYKNHQILDDSPMGMFITKDIDLRIFFDHWASVFAVEEQARGKARRSIQFFSQDGLAIHKMFLTDESVVEEYDKMIEKYKSDNQEIGETVTKGITNDREIAKDEDVDIEAFHKAWSSMSDAHDYFRVLRDFKLTRTQALKLAPKEYVTEINKDKIVTLLEESAKREIEIMVFVGNKGMTQIHMGKIKKTMWFNQWFNIMDPDFNMHLNMDGIHSAWVVKKPTLNNGIISSVEAFDKDGKTIVQFFGKRRSIKKQKKEWQQLVSELL